MHVQQICENAHTGSNQVECNSYRLSRSVTEDELKDKISDIVSNNEIIMSVVCKETFTHLKRALCAPCVTVLTPDFRDPGERSQPSVWKSLPSS